MNLIELKNNFWEIYYNSQTLSPTCVALYFHLLDVCNKGFWENPFFKKNKDIERDLKMTFNTIKTAREKLQTEGLISFKTRNGVSNVEYTLSKIHKVSREPYQKFTRLDETSSNFDEVENVTLSKIDEVNTQPCENFTSTLSKIDEVFIYNKNNKTLIENNKENIKEKEDLQPYENLTRSIIPTQDEVIDFFMSLEDLKPSEAEAIAKSFFSHFSAQGWRNGKSLIFDWVNEAKEWKISNKAICETQNISDNNLPAIEVKTPTIESKELKKRFKAPTIEEVRAYCEERGNGIDPEHFVAYYESIDWTLGKTKIKNWKLCVITWEKNNKKWGASSGKANIAKHDNTVTYGKF